MAQACHFSPVLALLVGLALLLSLGEASFAIVQEKVSSCCDESSTHIFAEPGISVATYIDRLKNGRTEWQRYNAAAALGELGAKSAIPALLEALTDSSESVRVNAIHSLGELHATKALPRLQQMIMDPSADVQVAAKQEIQALQSLQAHHHR